MSNRSEGATHENGRPFAHRAPLTVVTALAMTVAAVASAQDVSVSIERQGGVYSVRGAFTAPVPDSIDWQVLTDYDHIGAFVTSVRSSSLDRRPNGRLLLTQEAEGGVFAFKRRVHVMLDIQEEPRRRIFFADVLGRDFRCYIGNWIVEGMGDGSRVFYQLEAQPKAAMPGFLGRAVLRRSARALLEQVRAEMLRRAGRAG